MDECDEFSDTDVVEKFYELVVYDSEEDFDEQLPELIYYNMYSEEECISDSNETVSSGVQNESNSYELKMKVKRSRLVGNKRKSSLHHGQSSTSSITEEQDSDTNNSNSVLDLCRTASVKSSVNADTSQSSPQKKLKYSERHSLSSGTVRNLRRSMPANLNGYPQTSFVNAQRSGLVRKCFNIPESNFVAYNCVLAETDVQKLSAIGR